MKWGSISGHDFALLIVAAAGAALRFSWVLSPSLPYLVDEAYYVPAAIHYIAPFPSVSFLKIFNEDRLLPYYINPEHPPLAKLFIASAILLFGNNPVGWRIFSSVMGSLSIAGVYIAARKFSPKAAVFATAFYAFYPMNVAMSQIGMLDIYAVAFASFAFAAVAEDRLKLAALFTGLAAASKLPEATFAVVLLYYVVTRDARGGVRPRLRSFGVAVGVGAAAFFATFIPMALYFGVDAVAHDLVYMFTVQRYYGPGPGLFKPFQWLFDYSSSFNPTIFINNPALTAASIGAAVYCVFRLREKPALYLLGFYVAGLGLILAASVIRPIYFFYLTDLSPGLALMDAFMLEPLLSSQSPGTRRLGYLAGAVIVVFGLIGVSMYLRGYTLPYTSPLLGYRL